MNFRKYLVPLCFLIYAILVAVFWSHIPSGERSATYGYSDVREILGIPYAFDVLSNIAFAIFGLWGLFKLEFKTKLSYFKLAVALGIIWTAAGSTSDVRGLWNDHRVADCG